MQELKMILARIQKGELSFQASETDLAELNNFQETAKRILYADKNGYVQEVRILKDYTRPGGLIKNILIIGGLTFEGEQFLRAPEVQEPSGVYDDDILEIKPNIAGIGINLNALWRHLRKKRKQK